MDSNYWPRHGESSPPARHAASAHGSTRKEPILTDGCDSRAIVDETDWGARFSQLVADGIFAEKLPAEMAPGQQPTKGMAAR